MAALNRVLIIGNLTRDPELRYTPKQTAVAEISVAINRVTKDESGERREEVTFIDVTLWARQAEIAQQYLKKGRSVFIEGRLQMDTWLDKQTSQKRSRMRVVAENLQLLGSRQESELPRLARLGLLERLSPGRLWSPEGLNQRICRLAVIEVKQCLCEQITRIMQQGNMIGVFVAQTGVGIAKCDRGLAYSAQHEKRCPKIGLLEVNYG